MNIVGIDLGTTFSVISVLNTIGKPEIVPNNDSERMTPSALFFESENEILVGIEALNSAEMRNDLTARWIKRHMGENRYPIDFFGRSWTPSLLSSFILKKIADDFEVQKGKIDYAVVTVPAYFDEVRRKATLEAAQMAGINIKGIINEPTAAAIYYAFENSLKGKLLFYDLGGGTFDITILEMNGADVDIIASRGDHHLGGYDFDMALMQKMLEVYKSKYMLGNDDEFLNNIKLQREAEKIKKQLSKSGSAKTIVTFMDNILKFEITRDEFEALISSQTARIEMMIEVLLEEANISEADINNVVLVGGSTRMPFVKKTLTQMFGKEPMTIGNVDECVSLGAAIYCGMRVMEENPKDISQTVRDQLEKLFLYEINNHSYGAIVLSYDEMIGREVLINSIIIPKNSKIPIEVEDIFQTIHDNQNKLLITITQGEGTDPDMVSHIAKEYMSLPPNRPKGRPVKFIYSYDSNCMMNCKFIDLDSGQAHSMIIGTNDKDSSLHKMDADSIINLFDIK